MGINEMGQFLNDDRFLGIKYTSNDFFTMEQCKSNFPKKIVYNGFDFGICRHPFGEPDAEQKEWISKEIIPLI